MAKIAACLIVKNAEDTLERCLAPIRPFVDGIFVYDTGSTDGTLELIERLSLVSGLYVCEECGGTAFEKLPPDTTDGLHRDELAALPRRCLACSHVAPQRLVPLAPITVEQGEWRDDFSWAREQSFAMPDESFDWVVWLDDDDIIRGAEHFRQLATMAPLDLDGFVFKYDYARDDNGVCICELWRERLIRRDRGYRWHSPVHEVYLPPEGKAPAFAQIPPEQVLYIHQRPAERFAPNRNIDILLAEKERRERAGETVEPRTYAYLGTEWMVRREFQEAVGWLQQYLEQPATAWPDERSQVHHKIATCLRLLGNPTAAVEAEMRALRERDDWPENLIGLAAAFAQLGQWDRCERWARAGFALGVPRTHLILNPLELTLLPLVLITDACLHQGKFDQAREAIQHALQIAPTADVRAKAAEVDGRAQEAELVGAILYQREQLVRLDENLKAWDLLKTVPYTVVNHPLIAQARIEQREMVRHALEPAEYVRWYRDEPKESTVPDDAVETIDEYIDRAGYLLEGLQAQEEELGRKPVVLDLGCNDFWLSCFLWKRGGIVCDGVELNRASFEKGLARRKRFGAKGRIHHGDLHDAAQLTGKRYDAVALFEVLEHVPDVAETLDLLESLLVPGGRVYLTTPNGAYERGAIDGWAKVERKGHLRAIPATDLAATLVGRGQVKDFRVHHADGRLTFAAYEPREAKGTVSFFAGQSWEPWSPASLKKGGIGGSETALVRVAGGLAKDGYQVTVYSGADEGLYGGVLYRNFTAFDPAADVDLLVVSRMPSVFDLPVRAKRTALWCHDNEYPLLTEERAAKIDAIVVLSEWQRDRFAELYPHTADQLTIIRNGIQLFESDGSPRYAHAERGFSRRKPRVVYSSSADRGLDVLLEVWPPIRERVPDAELHVFYGWETFDRVAQTNPNLWALKTRILQLADEAGGEEGGVFMRGRVGQAELAEEMQQARVLAYPTAFLETSCITAMEARAAGMPIVSSELGALAETAAGQALLVWQADEAEPYNRSDAYKTRFVDLVSELLTEQEQWRVFHELALRDVRSLDWAGRIPEWEALLAPAATREMVAA